MSDIIIKICAMGILCAAVSVIIRGFSTPLSSSVKIGGVIIIFSMVVLMTSDVIESAELIVSRFDGYSEITAYWETMLRALGIALLCRICSDVCRDCGEGTVASGVETAGKITILALSLPMVEEILSSAEQLLDLV